MTYSELQPSTTCKTFIKHFWSLEKLVGIDEVQTLFPDSHPEVLLNIGGQIQLLSESGSTILPYFVSFGIQQRKIELVISKKVHFFSARLYPWASLGFPTLVAPAGEIRDLNKFLPKQNILTLTDFMQMIESFLEPSTDVIANLVNVFYEQEGLVRVLDTLDKFDISRRTLERFFEKNANLSAKKLLRVRRFEKAMSLLYFYPNTPLAEVGISLGYTDQAHFQREFKDFSGMTPGQFVRSLQKAI